MKNISSTTEDRTRGHNIIIWQNRESTRYLEIVYNNCLMLLKQLFCCFIGLNDKWAGSSISSSFITRTNVLELPFRPLRRGGGWFNSIFMAYLGFYWKSCKSMLLYEFLYILVKILSKSVNNFSKYDFSKNIWWRLCYLFRPLNRISGKNDFLKLWTSKLCNYSIKMAHISYKRSLGWYLETYRAFCWYLF